MSSETFCDRCEAPGARTMRVWIANDHWFDLCDACFDEVLAVLPDTPPRRRSLSPSKPFLLSSRKRRA